MTLNEKRMANRSSYGLMVGVLLASIAVGIVVWKLGDYDFNSVFYTVFAIVGAYLALMSFWKGAAFDFAPSESSFYLVTGVLLATVGILGFVDMLTNTDTWALVAIFIAVFALLVIYRSVSKKG